MISLANAPLDASTLAQYDWLGFDLDHCLCRYRLSTFLPLVHRLIADYLVHHCHYSQSLLHTPFDIDYACKGLVYDRQLGNLVKLNDSGHVNRATHGSQSLSKVEIQQQYSESLNGIESDTSGRYIVLYTFFECSLGCLLAQLVDLIDSDELFESEAHNDVDRGKRDYSVFIGDVFAAFEYHYGEFERGDYFAAFREHVEDYIYHRPSVAEWLRAMKRESDHGRAPRVFLLTNSRYNYTNLLCTYILGNDWQSLFHLTVCDAKKPSFFHRDVRRSFHEIDSATSQTRTDRPVDVATIAIGACVANGNSEDLEAVLRRISGNASEPRVLFFDDHLSSGVMAARAHTRWHSVGIVEEMDSVTHDHADADTDTSSGSEFVNPVVSTRFGSLLVCDPHDDDSEEAKVEVAPRSYWSAIIEKHAHYAIPCLSQLATSHSSCISSHHSSSSGNSSNSSPNEVRNERASG